jgi:hypothetical protein
MDGRTPYLEWRFAGSSEQELSRICKSYDRSRTQSWNWYPSDARRNAQFLILFVNLVARGHGVPHDGPCTFVHILLPLYETPATPFPKRFSVA